MPNYEKALGTFSVDRDDVEIRCYKADGVKRVELKAHDPNTEKVYTGDYAWTDIAGFDLGSGQVDLLVALNYFKADQGLSEV